DVGADDQLLLGGEPEIGIDQRGDHAVHLVTRQQFGGGCGAFRFNQLDAAMANAQPVVEGAAAGHGQALAIQLAQRCRFVLALARDQHVGVLQVGPADVQGGFALCAGRDGGDDVGAALVQLVDHVADAGAAMDLETQAGAQTDQLEQLAISQQHAVADAPALEDTGAHGAGDRVQGGIDQLEQQRVVGAQGEAEAHRLVFAEVHHLE
uniref:Nitrogenase iron protein n=1 Tax=Steinernema glaseri TaxID=37863 RepID=A0A1I8ADJ6_9BILA